MPPLIRQRPTPRGLNPGPEKTCGKDRKKMAKISGKGENAAVGGGGLAASGGQSGASRAGFSRYEWGKAGAGCDEADS
jgi:hypothetical protein